MKFFKFKFSPILQLRIKIFSVKNNSYIDFLWYWGGFFKYQLNIFNIILSSMLALIVLTVQTVYRVDIFHLVS